MNKFKFFIAAVLACIMAFALPCYAAEEIDISSDAGSFSTLEDVNVTVDGAAAAGEYTTIQVKANGQEPLMYAIDSDAPEAFQSSNEFVVLRGSEHLLYVKDSLGKISAQKYKVPMAEIEMEVNIGYSDTSSIAQVTDEEREAVENGGGTVAEKVITDNSTEAERLFYTITTKDEHVFYIMIDQSRSDNNVYLLDQVTDQDLFALTGVSASEKGDTEKGIIDLVEQVGADEGVNSKGEKKSGAGDIVLYGVIILMAGAIIYYYKVYKPKQEKNKDLDTAMDLDDFESDEDNQDDILDFSVSAEEKEAVLNEIINKNDLYEPEELMYDPDLAEEEELQEESNDVMEQEDISNFDEELDGEEEDD